MLMIHGIMIALLVVLGIVFSCGKGSFLIAGYNTASSKEREQYDEKALCRSMGGLMYVLAACTGVMALSGIFDSMAFFWIGFALFSVATIGGVFYINTSKKIKRK